jgi:hypothetical protein
MGGLRADFVALPPGEVGAGLAFHRSREAPVNEMCG